MFLSSLIPHHTQVFLRERINLWEQLNHISLCKYPCRPPTPSPDRGVSSQPHGPSGTGMHTGWINICSYSLQMAACACHRNETLAHAGERSGKCLSQGAINNSSGRAVTFAFRGTRIDRMGLFRNFWIRACFFIGNFIFLYAFRGITQHSLLTGGRITGGKYNISYRSLIAVHFKSLVSQRYERAKMTAAINSRGK